MGKDWSEFICSKDDTSMLEQIYSKGSSGSTYIISTLYFVVIKYILRPTFELKYII